MSAMLDAPNNLEKAETPPVRARQSLPDNYWFGYELDMDFGHIWFTENQDMAMSVLIDDRFDLLVDMETDELLGFIVKGFRSEYIAKMPIWQRILTRVGLLRPLSKEIPMQQIQLLEQSRSGSQVSHVVKAEIRQVPTQYFPQGGAMPC